MSEFSSLRLPSALEPARQPDSARQLWGLWRQGQQPDVDAFLTQAGRLVPQQLVAVLRVDQRERWQTGERIVAEAYLQRYPILGADPENTLDLVYGEFLLQEELGEGPTLQEYVRRFPLYADSLRLQIELHQGMALESALDPAATRRPLGAATGLAGRDATPAPQAAQTEPTVRGYEILGKLGRGGMGVVYKARQRDANRVVALKMILAGGDAGPEVLTRFRTEIEAVARLQHPHIVQIYEVGEWRAGDVSPPMPFFSMEFADDGSLAQKMSGIPLPFRRAAQLLELLARAIHYAHERGILHRDLAPSNVLLMADGTPKITDFGLAKILLGEPGVSTPPGQTQSGAILGTPSYMPPEQAAGKINEIGPAGDVYALGAILYEMLTGRPPFRAETPLETLRQVLSAEPVPPSRLQPHLPRDLVTICLKCLQKEPRKRYGSALELALDLGRFLSDKPITARRTGFSEQAWRWCRRKPAVAALTGAVALLLVAVAVGSTLSALWLRDQRNDATEKLWGSYLDQAKAGRFSGQIGQRFRSLDALEKAARIARERQMPEERFLELRNAAIACLALADLRIAKEWHGWPTGTWSVDFAGTLERYARVDRQGVVSVRRVADDTEIYQLPGMGPGESWQYFSPDGQFLAVVRLDRLQLWKLTDQKPVMLVEGPNAHDTLAFSPDSRQLARALPDGSLSLYDLPSGRQTKHFKASLRPRRLAFHPKDAQLAVRFASSVQIRDLATGSVLAELAQPAGNWLAWHPDGKTLAVDGPDRIVQIWDVATRKPIVRLEGHNNGGILFAFNHAGDLLASSGWDGKLRLWDPRTGQQLFHSPTSVHWLRFSTDDKLLAGSIDGATLRIWEVAPALGYRTLVRDPVLGASDYSESAIHPQGRLLAVAMGRGIDLWDLASGNHVASIKIPPLTRNLLFGPSDELLTNGTDGLRHWPIKTDPASAGLVRIGPPQKLPMPGSIFAISQSLDGLVLASAQQNMGGLVLHRDRPDQPIPLGPHEDVRFIAVSPDGRLVATGSHWGTKVKVWQTQRGKSDKPVTELPVETSSPVGFSPDGKWLATLGGGLRLWAVDSWQAGPHIGGSAWAFNPDCKLLAVETGNGVVRLVNPDTGREYARLEDPNQDRAGYMSFTPDGTQLVTTNNDNHSIHVWDLRTIRRQLAEIGLDWDLPAYPPVAQATDTKPLKVTVDLGNLAKPVPKD